MGFIKNTKSSENTIGNAPVSTVAQRFFQEPWRFSFGQGLFILEKLYGQRGQVTLQKLGQYSFVQLKSSTQLSAAPGDILSFKEDEGLWGFGALTVNFFGLAGIQGPLPTAYTEKILGRIKRKDYATAEFLDLFNHRLISIYRQARREIYITELPHQSEIGKCLLALAGFSSSHTFNKSELSAADMVNLTRPLWQKHRSGEGLAVLLSAIIGAEVKVQTFRGSFQYIEKSDQSRIGGKGSRVAQYNILGQDHYMGERYWDQCAGVTLELSAPTFDFYYECQPGARIYNRLKSAVKLFIGPSFTCDLKVSLPKKLMKTAPLGGANALNTLGYNSLGYSSTIGEINNCPNPRYLAYVNAL